MQAQQQPTVALLEDDPEIVEALQFLLRDKGLRVFVCSLRHDVLGCLVDTHPQLIILDVRMGAVDGVTVFQQLRANPSMNSVPVILFTATEQRVTSRVPNYRELNASFVGKPNIRQLTDRIDRILHP
jgi:DNA-binding response OmpR family regulator